MASEQRKAVADSKLAQKLLNTPLREVYQRIISMVGKAVWDQSFVAKLFDGFEQCLKALDSDYETIDLLTFYYHLELEAES